MKSFRYVRLDPTGNLTCLVLDPVEKAEEPGITARLMGGEFCGNAAMASACYLAE